MRAAFDNPILVHEWRSRWRDNRAFILLFCLVASAAAAFLWRLHKDSEFYAAIDLNHAHISVNQVSHFLGQSLVTQLAWTQVLAALMLAPAFTASSIALERERGLLDGLQLAPMHPLRIAVGKWFAGLALLLILGVAFLPLQAVALLYGGTEPRRIASILGLALLTLFFGGAVGLGCSAWARRAVHAQRSAYGLLILWSISSFVAALAAGETTISSPFLGATVPLPLIWWGRTNPVLTVLDLLRYQLPYDAKWPWCVGAMALGSVLLLWAAARGVTRPLPELQFIEKSKKGDSRTGGVTGVLSRLEVPLVGRFSFNNPVLGRELRGKFRFKTPPRMVLISEVVLGLMVSYFYVRMFFWALFEPSSRETIFWGVIFAGALISVLTCCGLGASAFPRERERGTWEAIRLAMLSPTEIVVGKTVAAISTCLFMLLLALPLLLPCVNWGGSYSKVPYTYTSGIALSQLLAAFLIWFSTVVSLILWSMLLGVRSRSAARAGGIATATALAWMLGLPVLFLINSPSDDVISFLGSIDPLVAMVCATAPDAETLAVSTGWPFVLCALIFCALIQALIRSAIEAEFSQGD